MADLGVYDFTGKVAVVTGGSRGIGRGIAEAFLQAGASVVINGRSEEKGQRALQEMGAAERTALQQCYLEPL